MATQYFEMTPGTGASMATREVGSAHYQRVTGDLYYEEGVKHLGGGNGSTDITSHAVGTLLTEMVTIGTSGDYPTLEPAVASSTNNKGDNGLVEIVDFDVVTVIRFFRFNDVRGCRLGVMFLDGDFAGTMNVDSPIVIDSANRDKILSMMPLYPIPNTKFGSGKVYNYTFHTDVGRHRTFINPSTRDIKMALYLHDGSYRRYHSNQWGTRENSNIPWSPTTGGQAFYGDVDQARMLRDQPESGANKMAWRITLDRTMI